MILRVQRSTINRMIQTMISQIHHHARLARGRTKQFPPAIVAVHQVPLVRGVKGRTRVGEQSHVRDRERHLGVLVQEIGPRAVGLGAGAGELAGEVVVAAGGGEPGDGQLVVGAA